MTHAQKPNFVFLRNGRVHLNRPVGASVHSITGSRGVRISGSNGGYTMFRGSVKVTGYPLHPPVSPSLPLPCVTVCHHVSTGLYLRHLFLLLAIFNRVHPSVFGSTQRPAVLPNCRLPLAAHDKLSLIIYWAFITNLLYTYKWNPWITACNTNYFNEFVPKTVHGTALI